VRYRTSASNLVKVLVEFQTLAREVPDIYFVSFLPLPIFTDDPYLILFWGVKELGLNSGPLPCKTGTLLKPHFQPLAPESLKSVNILYLQNIFTC
jgi:hypothetical protein